MNHNSKDIRALASEKAAKGWTTSHTGSGHLRWNHPSGAFVSSATTPSDRRSIQNIKAQLRKVERDSD